MTIQYRSNCAALFKPVSEPHWLRASLNSFCIQLLYEESSRVPFQDGMQTVAGLSVHAWWQLLSVKATQQLQESFVQD